MTDEPRAPAPLEAPPVPPAPPAAGGGPGWGIRERPVHEQRPWGEEPSPPPVAAATVPTAPTGPGVRSPLGPPPVKRSGGAAAPPAQGFPTTRQVAAVAIAGALVVGGLGLYLNQGRNAAPAPLTILPGGDVAVVHSGPAMLALQSLSGHGAGRSLALPGSPGTMVTTPDGTAAFLLDTSHGQVIRVDLVHGRVAAPIPAGKLPVDESLSADGSTLFVTDNLSGAVIPIDTGSGTPRPALQLTQGVDSFTPAPDGTDAVVSEYGGAAQPASIAFYTSASGLGTGLQVGRNSANAVFYSRDGATVWVLEDGVGSAPGTLIPIDAHSHAVGAGITVGHSPSTYAMTLDGSTVIVTNDIDRSVSVINLASRTVLATVGVGAGPANVAISANGATAWVACVLDRTLVPVDLRTHRAGAAVHVATTPSDLSLPASGGAAWVMSASSPGSVRFLTANNGFGPSLPVGNGPSLAIAHDSSTAWVANSLSDTIQHVDTSGQSDGPAIGVPRAPVGLVLTPDRRTLLVLGFGDGVHAGSLSAIDTASSAVRAPLAVEAAPSSLTVAPDGSAVYVANHQGNSITTVDLKTWRVVGTTVLPCAPSQLVITPDGSTIYADCNSVSAVVPVTTKDRRVGTPIAVANSPQLVMSNLGKLVFVKATGGLQEIDVASNKVVLSHAETGNIVGLAATPDDSMLVAVENTGGAVLLINAATLATTTSISVGARPDGVSLTPDGSRAYVLDRSAQKLYVVNVAAAKLTATIAVAPNASAVVVPAPQ